MRAFIFSVQVVAMLDSIGTATMKVCSDTPWTSVSIFELTYATVRCIGTSCLACKDNVPNPKDPRVVATRVDELAMECSILADKELCNVATRPEAKYEAFGI